MTIGRSRGKENPTDFGSGNHRLESHIFSHPQVELAPAQRAMLGELIDRFELARDAGQTLSPEELCNVAPELLPHLIASLRRLSTLDARLSAVPCLPIPEQIGEFTVIGILGAGSTGMVFRCRQQTPARDVAVKVLKPLLDVDQQQHRFQREMAAVACIREGGMAAVYQSGIVDWCGVRCLWFAMDILSGGTICEYVHSHQLSEAEILKLFRTVCLTLLAAHRMGILHRDVKPSNILMSEEGSPHVVDFGVAKLPLTMADVQHTETGTMSARGTAGWTAPELLLADPPLPGDTRSEIFSLGVVLFEMISGQHPFGAERLTVPQVSARIVQSATPELESVSPGASVDLAAFVGKLMAFNPDHRYQNLDDVLLDLNRLMDGQPVKARLVALGERVARWSARNWKSVATATAAVTALLMIVVTIIVSSERLKQQTRQLNDANHKLAERSQELEKRTLDLQHALDLQQRSVSNGILRSMQYTVATSPTVAQKMLHDDNVFPESRRGFAWQLLNQESSVDQRILATASSEIRSLNFHPDGSQLVARTGARQLLMFDLRNNRVRDGVASVLPNASLVHVPGKNSLLTLNAERSLVEVSSIDGDFIQHFPQTAGMQLTFALSPNRRQVAGISSDLIPFLIDLDTGIINVLGEPLAKAIVNLWYSKDGNVLHIVDQSLKYLELSVQDRALIRDCQLKETIPSLERLTRVDISDQMDGGHLMALGQALSRIHILKSSDGGFEDNSYLSSGDGRLHGLRFLPPSRLVSAAASVMIHDLWSQNRPRVLAASRNNVTAFDMTTDGGFVAVGDKNGCITLVSLNSPSIELMATDAAEHVVESRGGQPLSLSVIDNDRVVIGHGDGLVVTVDVSSAGNVEAFFHEGDEQLNAIDRHPTEHLFAMGSGGDNPRISVLRMHNQAQLLQPTENVFHEEYTPVFATGPPDDVRTLKFTPDGHSLLVALRNGQVWKFNCATWESDGQWQLHDRGIFCLAVHHDLCLTGGTDGMLRITRIANGETVAHWVAHDVRVRSTVFSPDGTRIYSGSVNGELRIWDAEGHLQHSTIAHEGSVVGMDISQDGQTLVTGGEDQRILIWDAVTGDLQREIDGHVRGVTDLKFLDDGSRLVSTGFDNFTRVWQGKRDESDSSSQK